MFIRCYSWPSWPLRSLTMSWFLPIKVRYFYMVKKKKRWGEFFCVSGGIRPHFVGVLHILQHCEVPNEMLELSWGLPHRKECTLGSSTVVPEQYRFFWSHDYSASSRCRVNVDGVYFHFSQRHFTNKLTLCSQTKEWRCLLSQRSNLN